MNVERDSDRELRAWVAEGIDRAPERFVWAALDQVEGTPQRTAWRTRLDGLATRLRPAAGLAGAAAAVVVAIAVLSRVVGPNVGTGEVAGFVMADLPGILLWEDTKPRTWTLDNLVSNPHEVRTIPIRSMTAAEIDALAEPGGYVGGRFVGFSGPDAVFMSWGALFERDVDAAAALTFYQGEMEAIEAWGLGAGEPTDLGDDGWVYTGETTAFTGQPTGTDPHPTQIYLWRDNNLLLAVGGWFDFDPAELRSVAGGMDARATTAVDEVP